MDPVRRTGGLDRLNPVGQRPGIAPGFCALLQSLSKSDKLGGWGSAIYQGSGASVRNVSGTVPVDNLSGTRALVLDAVNPPGAWWNVLFKISGNSFNYLRTGTNPAIHLRVKWANIPTNGAWNMTLGVGSGTVSLNAYVTASSNNWQDVYIPMSDFIASSPGVDLTHIWQLAFYAAGNYRDHCTLDIAALDLVPSALPDQRAYGDFIKVNQVGYAPLMSDKLAVVSWEPGTITTPPTSFPDCQRYQQPGCV